VLEALDTKWGVEAARPRKRPLVTMRIRQAEMRTLAGHRQAQPPASDAEALARLLASPEVAGLLHSRGLAGEQNYERAASAQKRLDSLAAKLQRAETAWLNQLGSRGTSTSPGS
jgi:hypothetical protein